MLLTRQSLKSINPAHNHGPRLSGALDTPFQLEYTNQGSETPGKKNEDILRLQYAERGW